MVINFFQRQILLEAINKYGEDNQKLITIEELSELQKAIIKYHRKPNAITLKDVAEEMADVYVMLEQMKLMFDNEVPVQQYIDYKITRLKNRIEEDNTVKVKVGETNE